MNCNRTVAIHEGGECLRKFMGAPKNGVPNS